MALPDSNNASDVIVTQAGIATRMNAIELLKGDHRHVEEWFSQFAATDDPRRKQMLAENICQALEVHARIEEEIFYPAFLDATGNEDLHDDAVDDHDTAMELILKIKTSSGPRQDDFYNAKVKVLAEAVREHVREEEKPGGMFDQAADAGLDLETLGLELEHRKIELMESRSANAGYDAAVARADDGEAIDAGFEDPEIDGSSFRS